MASQRDRNPVEQKYRAMFNEDNPYRTSMPKQYLFDHGDDQSAVGGIDDVDQARLAENRGNEFNYQPSGGEASGKFLANLANFAKKSGPSWALFGGLLVTLVTGLSMAFPALVPLQLAERLTETFDVQSLNTRTRVGKLSVYRFKRSHGPNDFIEARKSRLGFGKKHHRFSTMSQKQIELWEAQGYKFELEEASFGRKRIVSVEIDDPDAPGGRRKITNAADFNDRLLADPEWHNKHFNASKGKFGMYSDKITKSIRERLGIKFEPLSSKVKDGDLSKEKLEAEQDDKVRNGTETPDNAKAKLQSDLDHVKSEIESGNHSGEALDALKDKEAKLTKAIDSLDDANSAKLVGETSHAGIGKMLNAIDGISDACSFYNLANKLIYSAKVAKSIHLSRYAAGFLTMASSIKAGESTEEEMTMYLNKIMATNPITTNNPDGSREITDYEMNGFDSQAYRFMTDGYMDAPNESFRKMQLGVNDEGAIKGYLKIKESIENQARKLGLNVSQFCRVMDSFEVQALVIVGQVILALSTGFVGPIAVKMIDIAKQVGVTAFLLGAKIWMSTELQNGLGGNWVNSKTQGQDMVNALATGTAELSNKQAQGSGNLPLGQNSAIEQAFAQKSLINKKAAMIRQTHSPFDMTTRHTLMGSILAGSLPYMGRMHSFAGRIGSTWSYGLKSLTAVLPRVSALSEAEEIEAMRRTMNYCQDPEYRSFAGLNNSNPKDRLGIYPFCSMMLGVPQSETNSSDYSPHRVLEYLAPNTYEKDANGKLTTTLKDYTINYRYDGAGRVSNYQQARAKGREIEKYINGVLKDAGCEYNGSTKTCKTYFKPVDKNGRECSLVPIILSDGRVVSRGFAGLNTAEQKDNPCLDETGLNYEFEWAIDDRESSNGYFVQQKFVTKKGQNGQNELYYTDKHLTRPQWGVSSPVDPNYKYFNVLKRNVLNPLLSFKINCIERGEVPYGMQQLDEMASQGDKELGEARDGVRLGERLFGGLFGKLINSGQECVLKGKSDVNGALSEEQKRRIIFALYFMDERVQCMLDDNQGCAGDMVGQQYTTAGNGASDSQSGSSDLPPSNGQRDADGCQPPPAGTSRRYTELTDDEIRRITAAMMSEQGSNVKALAFEASLLANLTDKSKKFTSPKDYLLNSGWFNKYNVRRSYQAGRKCNRGNCYGAPTAEMIKAVDEVLRGGKRLTVADEHDSFSDIAWIQTGAKKYTNRKDIQNRANYVSGQTIISNRFGARYRFDCFPSANADPFGQKIGG